MKRTLIIAGGVTGLLYALIGPVVSYADTASPNDAFGFEVASWNVFILASVCCIGIGLLIGWATFLPVKRL